MGMGEWPVYYSPKTEMAEGRPLQMFTAIGKGVGNSVCEDPLVPAFTPFLCDVEHLKCKTVHILSFIGKLSLHSRLQH